ncbi:MAG: esterase-like activity of phytase family protein [Leptolyngbyaceae cyanobacterium RU_5_1]|nr:esterase-like activity of phytase family protein [Leptolyngbyaceae cyanobacterium RU_5_1]
MSDRRFNPLAWLITLAIALMPLLTACTLPQVSAEERLFLNLSLDFLGEYTLPKQKFQGTPVGGLSAITYDRKRDRIYAISDDRGDLAPSRFYTLKLSLDAADPKAPKLKRIEVEGATTLTDETGQPYAKGSVDPEGIALAPLGMTVFISSEGVASKGIAPFVREFDLKTGQGKRSLSIPEHYTPIKDNPPQGVGDNLGFEALTLNVQGGNSVAIEPFRLFTATESALMQDVDPEHPQQGASRNRMLHYYIDSRTLLVSEHLYPMDPPPDGAMYHGLTEILAIDQGGHFLSLERSFGINGFAVKLFQFASGGATDTSNFASFKVLQGVQPIRKQLLRDLSELNIAIDNLEGMTLGPQLPDGSQSLLLVSDDNFNQQQITQFLLFRLRGK